jgi:RNA polymerase sigma-70 factor, ECF subfamily
MSMSPEVLEVLQQHRRQFLSFLTPRVESERTVCACVAGLAGTLKPEYAQALRRVDLEGASLALLAEEAGITPNNAKVRLHRARQALARRLEQSCGTSCCRRGCVDCPGEPA